MWHQSHRLKLFWLLWLPAACFGQAPDGSRMESNPLNVYAPPCISQVKQYLTVNCQITATGGAQPYSYAFTGGFPTGMSMSTGLGWLDQRDTHRDNWRSGHSEGDRCRREDRNNFVHDHAGRVDRLGPMRERNLRHGSRLRDQNG